MATRTAIAAADRKVKEDELREKKRQNKRMYSLEKEMLPYKQMESASSTTKNISQAAYGKGGVAGGMSGSNPTSYYSEGFTRGNDPAWYKKFGLSEYSVKVPTFYRLGTELKDKWLRNGYDDTVAGIAVLTYLPTLPNQMKVNTVNVAYRHSPINTALTRFMAELRKLNSRIGDYDPSDIGLYWYANIGVVTPILNTAKALRAYNTYYAENRYLCRTFIKSCGFDPDDFIKNVPQYKAALIKWIGIFNSSAVLPQSLDFIKRYLWLATVVVKEHKGLNCQLYHFECPYGLTLSDDEDAVNVSHIAADWTFIGFENFMDTKLQNLYNSVGVVTMTADLRAAFPENTLIKLNPFNGDEQLVYSESMHDLEQIHNCRTIPNSEMNANFGDSISSIYDGLSGSIKYPGITYDNQGYLFQGKIVSGNMHPVHLSMDVQDFKNVMYMSCFNQIDNNFLNFYDSEYVSEDAVLEATRLRQILYPFSDEWNGYAFAVNGTEVITDIQLLVIRTDNEDSFIFNIHTDFDMYAAIALQYPVECTALSHVSSFDWFPWIKFYGEDDELFIYTFGEIDHAVALSNDNLRLIHEGCAYSLFYVDSFKANHIVK